LDRLVHGRELLDVLVRGARPEQAGVARLVVALPVPHPPGTVTHQPPDELPVRLLVAGGRGRQEIGRLPGAPPGAGAQGDPDFLIAGELPEQGVHRLPLVAAGLGLHLPPVQVRTDQSRAQSAGLSRELAGRAEQAVADAAHHPEPDPRWVERAGHGDVAGHRWRASQVKVYYVYLMFISYTPAMRKPADGPAPPIWAQPPPPPRQRLLGREEIVAAATALADEAGPDALTMKAVADRLGSYSAMALYRYVLSKDGLVDLMLDAATAEIPVPPTPGPDWRADLYSRAGQTRQMTKRHPWYAALYHTRPPAGPHMMQRLGFMLLVLTARGSTIPEAMTYSALIDRHIFGSGLQEA